MWGGEGTQRLLDTGRTCILNDMSSLCKGLKCDDVI